MLPALRIFFWIIKSMLLLIALFALVTWPYSWRRWIGVIGERSAAQGELGEHHWCSAEVQRGWIALCRSQIHQYHTDYANQLRDAIHKHGAGWRWKPWACPPGPLIFKTWTKVHRFGPLHVRYDQRPFWQGAETNRMLTAPNWSVALVAGVWPVSSIILATRRRRRLRRATREGLCKHCGYDLRATPEQGATLLPVCPECGAKSADNAHPSSGTPGAPGEGQGRGLSFTPTQ